MPSLRAMPPPARLALLLDSPQSMAPFSEPVPTYPQKPVSSLWLLSKAPTGNLACSVAGMRSAFYCTSAWG